jgi:hypothetical protein
MSQIISETEAELNPNATPAPVAPEVDGYDADRHLERALDHGLAVIAETQDYDAYKAEREDRMALARGDKAYRQDAERKEARQERWSGVNEVEQAKAASEAAMQAARATLDEVETWGHQTVADHVAHAELMGHARALDSAYEQANPGYLERCKETAQYYGKLAPHVYREMAASPFYAQLMETVCDFPEMIAEMNAEPPEATRVRIARAEGLLEARHHANRQAQHYQPAPARPSSAPKPIKTITGKGHSSRVTLEEADYDTFKAMRMREINKRR